MQLRLRVTTCARTGPFNMFSIRNTVYVALAQIWAIVMGVLGAGLVDKLWRMTGTHGAGPARLLLDHPLPFMMIPLGWITLASVVRVRPECTEDTRRSACLLGIYLLIGLIIFMIYADVTPWLNIDTRLRGDD